MTGQGKQALVNEGARGLPLSTLAGQPRPKEREFRPRQCWMLREAVEEHLVLRPGQPLHEKSVPLTEVVGTFLSTPRPPPNAPARRGDPVQRRQVLAAELAPIVGHDEEL